MFHCATAYFYVNFFSVLSIVFAGANKRVQWQSHELCSHCHCARAPRFKLQSTSIPINFQSNWCAHISRNKFSGKKRFNVFKLWTTDAFATLLHRSDRKTKINWTFLSSILVSKIFHTWHEVIRSLCSWWLQYDTDSQCKNQMQRKSTFLCDKTESHKLFLFQCKPTVAQKMAYFCTPYRL